MARGRGSSSSGGRGSKQRTVFKSARTGRFVTEKHAKRSPSTTYRQKV